MATRKKKAASTDSARTLTRSDLKQKIRALKKQRSEAGEHSAKAKVHEYNEKLRIWRRKLKKAARHKAA
jgi:site-specific recombinase